MKRLFLMLCVTMAFSQVGFTTKPSYLNRLFTIDQFYELSGIPVNQKYGQMQSLKFVYHLGNEEMYFIRTDRYPYHFNFCQNVFGLSRDLGEFNSYNYVASDEGRDYLLGNLHYNRSTNQFYFELSPADLMSIAAMHRLHDLLLNTIDFTENIPLLMNNIRLQELNTAEEIDIPAIQPKDIYGALTYQPLIEGVSIGYLQVAEANELELDCYSMSDILLLKGNSLELPICSAYITDEFQTPLSHLSILTRNRDIPSAAFKGIWMDSSVTSLEGHIVKVEVKYDTILISESNEIELNRHLRKIRKKKKKRIRIDKNINKNGVIPIADIDYKSKDYVGNKAANFGELSKLTSEGRFFTPEHAFAIPFHYYDAHCEKSGVNMLIDQLDEMNIGPDSLSVVLSYIRKRIKATEVDEDLITEIHEELGSQGTFERFRFRSSTNAEDSEQFNGAGLYMSKTAVLGHKKKTIQRALKKVWASLWSENAYLERAHYNIESSKVAMGVLVHRSFPDEAANGVVISKNIYKKNAMGFVVNVQVGEHSVVSPEPGVRCDQLIAYAGSTSKFYNSKKAIEIIDKSSILNGDMVLSEEETIHLARAVEQIKRHFYRIYGGYENYINFGLDIEFKIDGPNRQLYIKQVRKFR